MGLCTAKTCDVRKMQQNHQRIKKQEKSLKKNPHAFQHWERVCHPADALICDVHASLHGHAGDMLA